MNAVNQSEINNNVFLNANEEMMNNSIMNNSFQSNGSLKSFDREVQAKTKTILRRNIFGRYKNSPYLKGSPYTSH